MREFHYRVTTEDAASELSVRQLMRREFSFSSRLWGQIKRQQLVFLNGKPAEVWKTPVTGDRITIALPEEKSHFPPEAIPIDVLYEDEDLLLINKQPGICVHPTKGNPDHTIANGMAQYLLDTGQSFKIRFINRLDMDTSGVLALGKNAHAQSDFIRQSRLPFSEDPVQGVKKEYLALVDGLISQDQGMVDAPIGHRPDDIRRVVMAETDGGKPSVTHYQVIARLHVTAEAPSSQDGFSLLRLRLETGRTHQIRVHMAHLGHPVTGDPLYGRPLSARRQMLHAWRLSFPHPVSGKRLIITAPLPEDLTSLLSALGWSPSQV